MLQFSTEWYQFLTQTAKVSKPFFLHSIFFYLNKLMWSKVNKENQGLAFKPSEVRHFKLENLNRGFILLERCTLLSHSVNSATFRIFSTFTQDKLKGNKNFY